MSSQTASLVAVGDIYIDRAEPSSAFANHSKLIQTADIAFCNLEGACSELGTPVIGKLITMKMGSNIVPALAEAGFDVAAIANNHVLDFGYDGFLDTIHHLDEAGIAHIGGGENLAQARCPVYLEVNDLRVGFIGLAATIPWGYDATPERPGIAPIHVQTYYEPRYHLMSEQPGMPARIVNVINSEELEFYKEAVRELKQKANVAIVSIHWGVAYTGLPAPYQPELAHALIDAGADLILGHHPHVLQGVEIYKGVPIIYSLSNFVYDHNEPRFGRETMLVEALLVKSGLQQIAVRPVILPLSGEPRPADSGESQEFKILLDRLSVGMNSRFEWHDDRLEITSLSA